MESNSNNSDCTRFVKRAHFDVKCIYDQDHMCELWIENRSESDLRSCEVT